MRFCWVLKESCSWDGQLYNANSPMRFAKSQFFSFLVSGQFSRMQLFMLNSMFNFLPKEGVGDTTDSFAYDGHRVRKWNVTTGKYGEV